MTKCCSLGSYKVPYCKMGTGAYSQLVGTIYYEAFLEPRQVHNNIATDSEHTQDTPASKKTFDTHTFIYMTSFL